MHLVIVESPAKAKTINKYLGRDFKVLASFGHIRDLPSKNGSVRPDEDFAMTYEIQEDSNRHVAEIAKAVKGADSIYLATDPDREGEAISWHVVEALKERKALGKTTPVHRVTFTEITQKAVKHAIANPRAIDMDLVNAQQARRALDYLVGFTLSPVLWRKLPGSRSAGRVQSVALRLICERESEIERFISREYWDVALNLLTPKKEAFTARLTHWKGEKLEQFSITNQAQADALKSEASALSFSVTNLETRQQRRNPYPPFTTSTLQQDASRKLGFSTKKTMQLAQRLYEGVDIGGETVGLITYMRTDGVTVSADAITATREHVSSAYGKNYLPNAPRQYVTKAKNAQEAHEAVRPTDVDRTPEKVARYLEDDQRKLYELIWKRMVASQMEAAVFDQVIAEIASNDNKARARAVGSTLRFDGFYKLYREENEDSEEEESRLLPAMEKNDALALKEVIPAQHFTEPPPRYSEAGLVKKMEELGIGRPSTYSSIISVLQDRGYVKLEKKRFLPEGRGRVVTAFLESFFHTYVEYDFTATLEESLDAIARGDVMWKKVLHDFWDHFNATVKTASAQEGAQIVRTVEEALSSYIFPIDAEGKANRACPACSNGTLGLRLGKFGAFVGCSNYPECRHTRPLVQEEKSENENAAEGGAPQNSEPQILGEDEEGLSVSLRKGPYGWYVQLGVDAKHPKFKRVGLPRGRNPQSITLPDAIALLALPRLIGNHPESGKPIKAGIGRFGPFLQHDGAYTSIPKDDDVLAIGLNRAVTLIAEKAERDAAGGGKKPRRAAPAKAKTTKKTTTKKTTAKKPTKKK